jgi:hypothetical protein
MKQQPRSATDGVIDGSSGDAAGTAGERFAGALAAKDAAALRATLADPIDFQALTPGRHWQASTPGEVVDGIVLGAWFDAGDDITGLESVSTGQLPGREHVSYLLRVRNDDGDHLVEQQAYYNADGGGITWMRVLCSGYRPLGEATPP